MSDDVLSVPLWLWVLAVLGVLSLILFLRDSLSPGVAATAPHGATAATPDDLAAVQGIGPRIKELLHGAGISTFAALASTSTARQQEIVDAAGLRMADPETWPRQAALARDGK